MKAYEARLPATIIPSRASSQLLDLSTPRPLDLFHQPPFAEGVDDPLGRAGAGFDEAGRFGADGCDPAGLVEKWAERGRQLVGCADDRECPRGEHRRGIARALDPWTTKYRNSIGCRLEHRVDPVAESAADIGDMGDPVEVEQYPRPIDDHC